ncbi:MAG: pyrimidine biosynthesis enzyme [Dehalococcoidia bacterium]|nr:pyrimidine biosynthesis enzyme [Dehalococcoidia bacterium]
MPKQLNRIVSLVATALLLGLIEGALLAGCARPASGVTQVTLALDWYPNSNHAGLFVAQQKGYFTDEDLEVKLYTPSDPSTVLQTVGAGKDDFGISYQADVLIARSEGVPVVSIMGMVQHPLNSVMALKSSGIMRPRDLVGKKVGYPGIPYNISLLKTMVEKDGGDFSKVEVVNVDFDLVPALLSKRVDAFVGGYWTHENLLIEHLGQQVNVMRMEQWGVPDFYELVLVTNEKTIKERPDAVRKLVRALVRGYNDAGGNLNEALDTLVQTHPEVDKGMEDRGIRLLAPMWTDGAPSFGWQTAERWRSYAAWMQSQKVVEKPVDPDKAFTNSFVEEAAKSK